MITLFKTQDCRGCDAIEDSLEELCLRHDTVLVKPGDTPAGLPENARPPVLVDDGRAIQGVHDILRHLEKLAEFKELWYKFQSDVCYCDDSGQTE